MKRRKKNQNLNISLLPFLSILACLLGVLTLMITGVSFGRMEEPQEPIVDLDQKSTIPMQMKEYNKIRSEIVVLKKKIKSFKTKLSDATLKQKKYESSLKKNSSLEVDHQVLKTETKNTRKQLVVLSRYLDEKKTTTRKLTEENKQSEARVISQTKEISFRKDPANHPVTKVNVISSGSIENPYFMECKKDILTLIEKGKETQVFKSPLINDDKFINFVEKIRISNKSGIIFLVRESGTEIYDEAKKIAIYYSCKSGKIPVRGIGFIDTSMFKSDLPVTPNKPKYKISDFLKKKYGKNLPKESKGKTPSTGDQETGTKSNEKSKAPVSTDPSKDNKSLKNKKNELPKATK